MSISTLPNEMLDMILNQTGIPSPERIHLRAVSHLFRDILENGLPRENSLTIRVLGLNSFKKHAKRLSAASQEKSHVLLIKAPNFSKKKSITLIHRLFPRLRKLSFYSDSLIAWRNFVALLQPYIGTLASLKVSGESIQVSTRESVFGSLGQCINSLSNLSSLYLKEPTVNRYLLPHLGPTLSRLERFSVKKPLSWENATFLTRSLSSRCTHLRLDCDETQLDDTLARTLAPNLTHLHLTYSEIPLFTLHEPHLQFVSQLTRLTNLTLVAKNAPNLDTLFTALRPLSRLTQVSISGIYYRHPLAAPPSIASTFSSVQHLALNFKYIFDDESFSGAHLLATLASWFPNLSTCTLAFSPYDRKEMEDHLLGHPFTVKLLDFEEWSQLAKSSFKATFG